MLLYKYGQKPDYFRFHQDIIAYSCSIFVFGRYYKACTAPLNRQSLQTT